MDAGTRDSSQSLEQEVTVKELQKQLLWAEEQITFWKTECKRIDNNWKDTWKLANERFLEQRAQLAQAESLLKQLAGKPKELVYG